MKTDLERTPRVEGTKSLRWTRRHVLDIDDWRRDEIESVLETTSAMVEILQRPVRKAPPLRNRTDRHAETSTN